MTTNQYKPSTRSLSQCLALVLMLIVVSLALISQAQAFVSGSNGSDGALNLTTPGTIDFDPVALGIDADGDNVFHFTTITIGPGVTLRLSATHLNLSGPAFWLASGNVQIDGTIDLNGEDGLSSQEIIEQGTIPSLPGQGGFGGGIAGTAFSSSTIGFGPGGGGHSISGFRIIGQGAGHAAAGSRPPAFGGGDGGPAYGTDFLLPLVGGSGGAGGGASSAGISGGGGGAGGGALLIASSTSVSIVGTIQAKGGKGGDGYFGGGGGSGGSIHLLAPTVTVGGALSAIGGGGGFSTSTSSVWRGGAGAKGRVRIEGIQRTVTGSITPAPIIATPFAAILPVAQPLVRVVSVGGLPVPSHPTGSFTLPDVAIDTSAPVNVEIEARNIPVGTIVELHFISEAASENQVVNSAPLAGTLALSTSTASVTIPSGFSRGFARAKW